MKKLSLPTPQKTIARVLQTTDQEIYLSEQALELFRQQKKGLMQQLLTGKVRVKNINT